MKIALITDTHWGVRNDSPVFLDANKKFLDNVFFPFLRSNKINTVIHLGDVLDRRKYVNINTANRIRSDLIEPLVAMNVKYHQILGNHDVMFKNTNKVSSFTELFCKYDSHISIYENATEVEFDGLKILLVPWINDENRNDTLKLLKETNAQICFGHLELQGFQMYKGSIVSHGDDPKIFDRFDIVASGHYHHRSSSGNIHYLGTHAEFTWSDYDDPRGFHVFDTKRRVLSFIKNPEVMFKKIWYNDVDKEFEDVVNIDYSQYKDKIIKVIVTNKTNPYWFDQFIDRLENVGLCEMQIVEDHLNLNLEEDQDIVNEAESTIDIFKKFISQVSTEGVDKNRLEKVIVDLYHDAISLE